MCRKGQHAYECDDFPTDLDLPLRSLLADDTEVIAYKLHGGTTQRF
jgi:hypothetical protein